MNLNIFILILSCIFLILDLIVFIKIRQDKKDIEENIDRVGADDKEIFLDFFVR